jgi:hypothetical protein
LSLIFWDTLCMSSSLHLSPLSVLRQYNHTTVSHSEKLHPVSLIRLKCKNTHVRLYVASWLLKAIRNYEHDDKRKWATYCYMSILLMGIDPLPNKWERWSLRTLDNLDNHVRQCRWNRSTPFKFNVIQHMYQRVRRTHRTQWVRRLSCPLLRLYHLPQDTYIKMGAPVLEPSRSSPKMYTRYWSSMLCFLAGV